MYNKSRRKNVFNSSWLVDARFKSWLASASAKHSARCTLCSKEFNINNGGVSNLVSHSKSKKHIELQNSAGSYSKLCFKKPGETVYGNVSDLQIFKKPLFSTPAEIRWVLKVVY